MVVKMKRGMVKILPFFLLLLLLPACRQEVEEKVLPDARQLQEAFLVSNKHLLALEEEAIDDFIERYGWEMQQTGSGLRVKIYDEGAGEKASYGQRVVLDYTIYLLTGDPVYTSEDVGPMTFTVGRGGVERGLEEGVLMLAEGGKAVFIMPHHLAYGVPGDGKQIPKRATIIYEVEMLAIH